MLTLSYTRPTRPADLILFDDVYTRVRSWYVWRSSDSYILLSSLVFFEYLCNDKWRRGREKQAHRRLISEFPLRCRTGYSSSWGLPWIADHIWRSWRSSRNRRVSTVNWRWRRYHLTGRRSNQRTRKKIWQTHPVLLGFGHVSVQTPASRCLWSEYRAGHS